MHGMERLSGVVGNLFFQRVVLCRNCPEQKLKTGDEATLLDFIPHPEGGEESCILEIFDEDVGRVAIVQISAVRRSTR